MKKVTAAVVIINSAGDILGCHGYGKSIEYGFDFPKGIVDEGETDIDAAVRELREETGLVVNKEKLVDCGIYKHNKEKDIHIFMLRTELFPDIEKLKCDSFFELNGKLFPEVDFFSIIKKDERYKFNKVLHNKFHLIDEFNC